MGKLNKTNVHKLFILLLLCAFIGMLSVNSKVTADDRNISNKIENSMRTDNIKEGCSRTDNGPKEFPGEEKIDEELADKLEKSEDENMMVGVWLKDIETLDIEKQAIKKAGISAMETADDKAIQNYIETKRALLKKAYQAYNSSIYSKYISDKDVVFTSSYAPFIITKQSGSSILDMAGKEEIAAIRLCHERPKYEETSSSYPSINVDYTRNNLGLTGAGVKIGILENGYPDRNTPQLQGKNIVLDTTIDIAEKHQKDHATRVACMIAGSVDGICPDAAIYFAASNNYAADFDKLEWLISQGVNVINFSAGYEQSAQAGYYTDMAKWIDYLVYQLDIIFVKSAGNTGPDGYITDPGMAYNAITVGAISDKDTSDWSDDELWNKSSYLEYEGGYKPDLTAPGDNIKVTDMEANSGTSYAAPQITGVIAQLMQYKAKLKQMPCTVNAILKAGTYHKSADDYGVYELIPDYSDKEGAGVIDALGAFNVVKANQYHIMQVSRSSFPFVKEINVNNTDKPIRIAVNWLKQNVLDENKIPIDQSLTDLDLYVYQPDGTLAKSSCSAMNNTELVEFMPTMKGTYKIEVRSFQFKNDYEVLGLAWF